MDLQQKYDNDAIFDRFDLKWSPSGQYVSTPSYSDTFTVFKLSQSRTVKTGRKNSSAAGNGGDTSVNQTPSSQFPEPKHYTIVANSQ